MRKQTKDLLTKRVLPILMSVALLVGLTPFISSPLDLSRGQALGEDNTESGVVTQDSSSQNAQVPPADNSSASEQSAVIETNTGQNNSVKTTTSDTESNKTTDKKASTSTGDSLVKEGTTSSQANDGNTPVATEDKTTTPASDESTNTLALAPQATQDVVVQYGGSPVTAVSGTFTFGTANTTMTVKVNDVAYTGSETSFPADSGQTVELTFAGIPAGNTVTIAKSTGNIVVTADGSCTFTMDSTISRLDISISQSSFQVIENNNSVTAATGTFAFDAGVTMTAAVNGTPYAGNTDYVPAITGQTVKLTFAGIPTGATVEIEKAGGGKTIKSTDAEKTFSFTMDDSIRTVNVSVNSNVTLALNVASSQYNSTFKTDCATFMYRVNGGAWTDLSDGITSGAVKEKASGGQYKYVMPAGTIDLKVIQPYDSATGKYKTNNGVGLMMEYTTAAGVLMQPYPEEFNGAAGLEIDGYSEPALYTFNFFPPFWSLIWSTTPNSVITADEVLKNGTFLVVDYDKNKAIDATMSHQAADGTEGYMVVTDPVGEITASFTPLRGYQILSSTIRDTQGNAISVTPDVNNVCTFTFNIANNKNMHVCSAFVTVPDTAETTSADLAGVTVADTPDTQAAIDSGSLNLSVTDATATEAVSTAAVEAVGSGTAVATFDVNLEQYWNQASTTAAWTKGLTETATPVTFSMELTESLQLPAGETYQVVREHEGTSEVVDATYDVATNTVTVASNQFSEFTLVKTKTNSSPSSSAGTSSTGTKSTTSSLAKTSDNIPFGAIAVIGLAALALAAYSTKRLRKQR